MRMTIKYVSSTSEEFAPIKAQVKTQVIDEDYKDLFGNEWRYEKGFSVALVETMGTEKKAVGFVIDANWSGNSRTQKGYSLITRNYIKNLSSRDVAIRWVKAQAKSNP